MEVPSGGWRVDGPSIPRPGHFPECPLGFSRSVDDRRTCGIPWSMRIAVVGGGPGGLYFSALVKQLDPSHEVTVWERNAPDDTFGFGVVFSDETLGGIEHADPVVFGEMQRHFARWDDIDVHHRGTTTTSGGHGFAAMSRKELLGILQRRCADLGVTVHFRTEAPRPRPAAGGVRPRPRRRRRPVAGPHRLRRRVPPDLRDPPLQVHVAGHRPGLRGLQVLRRGDAVRRHADPRLPLRPHRQHLHRRDARRRLAAGVRRHRGDGPAAGRERHEVHRPGRAAVRRRPRRAPRLREQLEVAELPVAAQRDLAARQPGADRRRRAHGALLHRVGHEARDGGRAGAGRLPARAARPRRRADRLRGGAAAGGPLHPARRAGQPRVVRGHRPLRAPGRPSSSPSTSSPAAAG